MYLINATTFYFSTVALFAQVTSTCICRFQCANERGREGKMYAQQCSSPKHDCKRVDLKMLLSLCSKIEIFWKVSSDAFFFINIFGLRYFYTWMTQLLPLLCELVSLQYSLVCRKCIQNVTNGSYSNRGPVEANPLPFIDTIWRKLIGTPIL